jgi:cob(I)alamin adenosyltransferase
MKIYTKTGDKGKTTLIGGSKVSKADIKVEIYGSIDEVNSFIGLAINFLFSKEHQAILFNVQKNLFKLGNIFATDWAKFDISQHCINENDIEELEQQIDLLSKNVKMPEGFVLPGGTVASSYLHVCRAICRRTERLAVLYSEKFEGESIEAKFVKTGCIFLNRLSDLLFVLAVANV